MKDLTKAIDTLDSIQKVMSCMKEHTHDGITITTTNTEYTFEQYGDISVHIEVENKRNPEYENHTFILFSFWLDYAEVKEIIMLNYNRMCEEIHAYIEEEKRVNIDEAMR